MRSPRRFNTLAGSSLEACCIRFLSRSPHSYPRSTIGSSRLNFRVRDGNGCDPADKITGKVVKQLLVFGPGSLVFDLSRCLNQLSPETQRPKTQVLRPGKNRIVTERQAVQGAACLLLE